MLVAVGRNAKERGGGAWTTGAYQSLGGRGVSGSGEAGDLRKEWNFHWLPRTKLLRYRCESLAEFRESARWGMTAGSTDKSNIPEQS